MTVTEAGHRLYWVTRSPVSSSNWGLGADHALRGARVACETFYATYGTCDRCREGRPNLCATRVSIGSGVHGVFAETRAVRARYMHRLPKHLPTVSGVLAEPLACVCQSLLDPPRVQPDDRVLVSSPGTIGPLAAQVSRRLGRDVTVVGLERDTSRLAAASRGAE